MEILNSLLGFIGLIVGFFLSEISKWLTDKKENKKKLNKVLFHLLEIRHIFSTEIVIENHIQEFKEIFKEIIPKEEFDKMTPEEINHGFLQIGYLIKKFTLENNPDLQKSEHLVANFNTIIFELAEIRPILAYKLSGKYNVKDKLEKLNSFFAEIDTEINDPQIKMIDLFNPIINSEALKDIDENIIDIAKMINKETLKSIELKISEMDKVDTKGMKEYLSNFINQIPKN